MAGFPRAALRLPGAIFASSLRDGPFRWAASIVRSGWFIEWDEWGKMGVERCEVAHIHLAKRGPKLVRLS